MDEQRTWIQSRRRKRCRIAAVVLSICVLVTNYPDIWGTLSVFAEEMQNGDDTVYVSDFASLPDTLEAVAALSEGEALPEDAEEETEALTESTEEETETPPEGAEEETEALLEGMGKEAESQETDGETDAPEQGDSQTEESQGGIEPEASEEAFTKLAAWAEIAEQIAGNSMAMATVESGSCGENLTWTLDDAGTLTISGTGEMKYWYSENNVPWDAQRANIKSVVINSGVANIGNYAFKLCEGLTSVDIPDTVTAIGSYAFYGCDGLTSVDIPDSVTRIGQDAFGACEGLTSVDIPDGVTKIDDQAFMGCSNLQSVKLPKSLNIINLNAFSGCKKLTSINIPDSVTSIGIWAFASTGLTSVDIPANVTSIGQWAFENCSSLTKVIFTGSTPPTLGRECFKNSACLSNNGIRVPCSWGDSFATTDNGWETYKDNGTKVHGSLTVVPETPATCTATGIKEHWKCSVCGALFLDEEGTQLVTDADIIIGTSDHAYTYFATGNVITEICQNCSTHTATATLTLKDGANLTYTGSEIKPVTVAYSDDWAGTGTEKPDDTKIVYTNNTTATTATAKLTISGQTASLNFTIAPKPLTDGMITLASGPFSYTGSEIEPVVTVQDGSNTLVSGIDYTVSYENNVNVGTDTAKVTVTGKGNYTGMIDKTFEITAADISGATVTLSSTTLTYNGSAQTKGVDSVTVDGRTLTEGTDYTVSGNTGTAAGPHTITIMGIGGYAGSTKEVTYTIEPKSLTADMVSIASGPYYYNGLGITPAVTVKDGGTTLVSGTDYTVSYENNVNVGTGTAIVKIAGMGNYKDTISETFTIEYRQLPSGSLTDYVTISPEPTNGWYGFNITLTPTNGCEVGETSAGIGSNPVIISDETGTDGSIKKIYIKDKDGNIYETAFPYKLDQTFPAVDLMDMTVENGTKGLWNWIIGKKSMIIKIPVSCITETLSGIAEVSYRATPEGGGAGKSGTIPAKNGIYEIALDEEFTGTIQLTVKDKVGHTTQVTLPAENGKVIAEDYPPVVAFALPDTAQPNENGWYNTQIAITVTVTDDKDSGSKAVTSGGIAEIQWRDGESGEEHTVEGLPGTTAVYEKTFSIPTEDGTHTYYVKAVDNAGNVSAGNESGWQSITVKVDTGKPVFNGNLTATNLTKESTDITFIPSEGGKAYWIVSDTGTAPTAQEVKTQSGQNGGVQDIAGGTEVSVTIIGLSAGEKHTVYVVLEDAAGNLSEVKAESFFTLQEAPAVKPEQVTVDYIHETITLPTGIGDVEAYTNPDNPSESKITPNGDGSLPVTPGTAVYIRYPEKLDGGLTMPASDSVKIDIPGRPDKPAAKQVTVTDTTATVTNPLSGEEYILVPRGQTPDWSNANTTGQFAGLASNQPYDLYVRKKAAGNSFASDPVKTELRTHVTIRTPVIEGDGAGKSGNTAPKPDTPNTDGTVTFTGTYSEEYTPVIWIGSQEILPGDGTAGSGMIWDEGKKKGTWEYTLTIQDDAAEAEITVEFRKRALTGIQVTPDALTIYADDAANESLDTLTAYVKANSSAEAVYDNKTSGTVQAAYAATGSFAQKGGTYPYTASAEGKTDNTTLTVKTVSATVTAPDTWMQVQKSGGYTAAEVAAWLPPQVKVTYTGDGYTARTENRTVTWSTASIGPGFGAALGKNTISGIVELPPWATGGSAVSMEIEFTDKIVLREDQIQLAMPGFSYGAQTLPNPKGSITVTDTHPTYAYLYSTDGGVTWVTADKLPKSDGGYLVPGEYRVKMTYRGDRYTGGKTTSFTVAKKALTILPGTFAVQDKNYDGTTDAVLKEGGQPVLSGVAAGDTVTLGGSLSAVFTEKGPKKNIPVIVTGFVLEGKDAGYYTFHNTTLILYATINHADGTPPADGGGNSGGGRDDHDDGGKDGNGGGDSNTSGDNNGSGTPAVTPTPVTPFAAIKQSAPDIDTDSSTEGTTKKGDTENKRKDAAAGNTDPLKPGQKQGHTSRTGQGNTDSAQTENRQMGETRSQTLQASLEDGRLTIAGDPVATGNITETSETRTILEAGDGTVIVTVVCGDETCTAGVRDTAAVANAVLSTEQIQLVNDGETIEIRVDVKDISETVPGQDKEVIENGLAEYRKKRPDLTLGMYVDISMFVRVGEGDWSAVTFTAEPIEVVVGIPEELKRDSRKFFIIRSHDGAYTLLPDLDDDPDTITVSTDMFSAYAIAYEQADGNAKCGLCHICPTFLGICCLIWLAAIAAMLLIVWMVIWRKREEEVK